jgi:MFS family permease
LHRSILSLQKQVRLFEPSARLFLLATVLDGIVFSAWWLFFNFYILGLGYDRQFLGLVNSMPSLASLLFGIPIGMLSDRLGRKRSMLIGVAVAMLCLGLQVSVRSPGLILAFGFLSGAANMLYYISRAPYMMKVSTPENRTLLFSLNFGLMTISGAVGSLVAGLLPARFASLLDVAPGSATAYQAVLLCSIALGLLTLIPLALLREPASAVVRGGEPASRTGLWRVIFRPLTLKLTLPNLLIGTGAALLIPYLNIFFVDKFGLPDQQLGVLFSLSAVVTGVASASAPRLERRLGGKIRAIVFTQAASILFLMLIGFSSVYWLVVASFLLRAALMNLAVPLYEAFAMELTSEAEQGTVNSVLELGWQLGWTVGPYASGVVQQSYGFSPLFIATSALYALAIATAWGFFGKQERKLALEASG